MKFIGRRDELSALNREYTNGHGFVVIYGRRRIGKTTLIKEFIKDKKALYFLADMESERQNMNKLTSKIADFTGQSYLSNVRFDTWQKLFAVFADNYPEQQKILVIDEFQYLVQSNPAFPSVFQEVWDELFKEKNIMVILCGSHISMMMSEVLSHSSPLYGRRTAQIRLQPLKFLEFSQAFPEHSFENRMMIYSVTGGVPKYMEFFCNDQTFEENILLITIPLLVAGGLLTWFAIVNDNGFQIVWRYFSWSNQTLAMIALWVATAYLLKEGKYRFGSLLTALPAVFMTGVSLTYILIAQEGFRLGQTISYTAGVAAAFIMLVIYLIILMKHIRKKSVLQSN